jgi:phosphoribosyl-ATP pyrophosphohydrolase
MIPVLEKIDLPHHWNVILHHMLISLAKVSARAEAREKLKLVNEM